MNGLSNTTENRASYQCFTESASPGTWWCSVNNPNRLVFADSERLSEVQPNTDLPLINVIGFSEVNFSEHRTVNISLVSL